RQPQEPRVVVRRALARVGRLHLIQLLHLILFAHRLQLVQPFLLLVGRQHLLDLLLLVLDHLEVAVHLLWLLGRLLRWRGLGRRLVLQGRQVVGQLHVGDDRGRGGAGRFRRRGRLVLEWR